MHISTIRVFQFVGISVALIAIATSHYNLAIGFALMATVLESLVDKKEASCKDSSRAAVVLALGLLTAPAALAQSPASDETNATDQPALQVTNPPLFLLEDGDSKVYLLGSVHMLPEGALPLPALVEAAYAEADVLAFELNIDDAVNAAPAMMEAGQGEASVADALSAEQKARYDAFMTALGVPQGALDNFEPWMASLTGASVVAQQAGATGEGVDAHFFNRAKADEKPRVAFETVTYQIEALDNLTTEEQVAFLMSMVEDTPEASIQTLNEIVEAWALGQDDHLAALMQEGMTSASVAYEVLLTKRNREWLPQVTALLDRTNEAGEPLNALVVVGAGHLVGDDSVVSMLRDAGYTVNRL